MQTLLLVLGVLVFFLLARLTISGSQTILPILASGERPQGHVSLGQGGIGSIFCEDELQLRAAMC